jgi:hypothetical protein
MVALQNIDNKGVPCKIFLAKELRDVSASIGRLRLQGGAQRRCRDDDVKNDFCDDCAPGIGNNLQGLAVEVEAYGGLIEERWLPKHVLLTTSA